MKTKLLCCLLSFSVWIGFAQITLEQIDDFQDGTVQGWVIGNGNPSGFGTSVVPNAGPDGSGDFALNYTSTGGGGIASRMVVFNQSANWQGNYIAQNIEAIQLDVKAEINDLNLKIAFQRGTNSNFTRIATINPVIILAGSGWTTIEIPMSTDNFEIVDNFQGNYTITEVLEDVSVIRILSNPNSFWLGESISANIRLDNINPTSTLNVPSIDTQMEFDISPNPATSNLSIKLSNDLLNSKVEVYDVLGKRIFSDVLNKLQTRIDVSNWNEGIYLVKLSTNNSTITKRFVKR